MKYYKILTNTEFIGVINSGNFLAENPYGWLLTSNENYGQYVSYKNKLYRDYWMQPIPNAHREYENVSIIEIDKEEYDRLYEAIEQDEEIVIDDDDEDEIVPEPIVEPDFVLEFLREAKIKEMSKACQKTIEDGFDITLSDSNEHFSLTAQDQLNLITLASLADTQDLIPYHADGEICRFYTAAEIKLLMATATQYKIYHTTYYNALKNYINSLETEEEIAAIEYGIELPEEFQSDALKAIS